MDPRHCRENFSALRQPADLASSTIFRLYDRGLLVGKSTPLVLAPGYGNRLTSSPRTESFRIEFIGFELKWK
jgi:hypothetical protein